jgi:hypothetical protein
MDHFLHDHCKDGQGRLGERLGWYAFNLRKVFSAALDADSNASLTIFSDHRMTPVEHRFDLVKQVKESGFVMPKDYLAVYDSTMARFWFFNPEAGKKITDVLRAQTCGRILSDQELTSLGVFFPDRRYGELIFLLHPGWLISASDFNGKGWMPVGMHGYHPDDPYSDGIFLSNRNPSSQVESVADVYQCMEQALASATPVCEGVQP